MATAPEITIEAKTKHQGTTIHGQTALPLLAARAPPVAVMTTAASTAAMGRKRAVAPPTFEQIGFSSGDPESQASVPSIVYAPKTQAMGLKQIKSTAEANTARRPTLLLRRRSEDMM